MKKLAIILFCFMVFVAKAQATEEDQIKQVIHNSVSDSKNFSIEKTYLNSKDTRRVISTKNVYFSTKSYDSLLALNASWEEDLASNMFIDNNYKIKQNGNLVFAEYDVTLINKIFAGGKFLYNNYCTLVKENGDWKIFSQVYTCPESYSFNTPNQKEAFINQIGYDLLAVKKTSAAIDIFKENVSLFPNAWNTYDSLAEAYAAAGKKKLAIKNYEKAMQLNPDQDSSAMIVALKK